jgi:S-layer glycoprotein
MYITGNAEGDPIQGVAIWILGKNYVSYTTETVEDNGVFEYKLSNTSDLAPGQYFVVVQHPMTNDLFDLAPQAGNPAVGQTAVVRPVLDRQLATPAGLLPPVFILEGTGSLQGSNAATALVNAMNSADIDDTYYKLTFMIEEPKIIISPIGDKYVGETFTISGTTNLAVGDSLIVDVSSSSFRPAEKTQASGFSGQSGSVLVTAGDKDGENVWEFEVDASSFVPDEYIVKVQGIVADQTATQTFNVLKADETPVATATPVSTPVATATAVPTAEPTAEPTAAPGFGVLVSLIGLGAVAALIARKD